jgi:hypothetical protein
MPDGEFDSRSEAKSERNGNASELASVVPAFASVRSDGYRGQKMRGTGFELPKLTSLVSTFESARIDGSPH